MSTLTGGPGLVTDGLVLYLDAANPYSYVSGSAVWRDLSRSQLSGSLINGPTFSTGSGGSIVFDGVNDYVATTIPTSSAFSFCMFVNKNTAPIANESFISTLGNNNRFQFNPPSSSFSWRYRAFDGSYSTFASANNYINLNTWYHITVTYNESTVNFYKNSTFTDTFTSVSLYEGFGSTIWVGGNLVNDVYFNGTIANTQIYNRALTASEVLQNYNVTKTRFGL